MGAAQQDEIGEIGAPSHRPGDDVVYPEPPGVAASGVLTSSTISFVDQTTEPAGDRSARPSDVDDLFAVPDDRFDPLVRKPGMKR